MRRTTPFTVSTAFILLGLLYLIVLFHDEGNSLKPSSHALTIRLANNFPKLTNETSDESVWSPCQRNESAASVSGFSSLPHHIQDFLYYRHCRSFPMLLDVPYKCGGADNDVFLLLVIKSSPWNYDRRQVLRKTWAEERLYRGVQIRRLFLSGSVSTGWEKQRVNKLLELEHREYNDVLQWDFYDSFFNLTLKQILFLEWMERNCPQARFLLNGDDDVFANTDNMVEYLQSLKDNDGSNHLFVGKLIENPHPVRWTLSKYYVPVQVQESNHYPSYCGGGGFLLSGYTAMAIYAMSFSVPLSPIDDVYMGMCLERAKLKPAAHLGIYTFGLNWHSKIVDITDPCLYRDLLLVHKFSPHDMYFMWHAIQFPGRKCSRLQTLV